MRLQPLPVLLLMLSSGVVVAEEPSDDPLAGTPMIGAVQIDFTPGIPLLTPESRARLKPLAAQGHESQCYWIAKGHDANEVQTLKAALAENDIATERVATHVEPEAIAAEARLYCTPPDHITTYFMPGASALTDAARNLLSIAAAGYWSSSEALVVRGYAISAEATDPLKLGLDRAIAVRSYLIAQGIAPKRLAIEANTQATGRDALRVMVMPRKP
jgi:outer membrane protein OmpA-like peptidoglycan-associated protein